MCTVRAGSSFRLPCPPRRFTSRFGGAAVLIAVALASPAGLWAQPAGQPVRTAQDLKRLSIEELASLDVTSVSRRTERLAETAAATSVVRHEDIRRSGATTLPEAMRLADGLDVARVNSSTWAISARGFNTNPANKLLVLLDGRSVYSPLSSGTFWDAQEVLLNDVDRVEVVRGPGGTLWGANAVNGVVNIIMKDAAATRGDFVTITGGSDEHVVAGARHGGRLGANGSYRVYGRYRQRGAQVFTATGLSSGDPVQTGQGGFRLESGSQSAARWFLEGDLYRGTTGFSDRPDGDIAGGNLVGRWTRRFSSTAEFRAQGNYDRSYRNVPRQFEESRQTFDLDMQHRLMAGARHDLVLGGGWRVTHGDDLGIAGFFFSPQVRTSTLASLFAQDDITIVPRRLFLTVGSKFERNDFTGLEVQPTVRGRWSPTDRQTAWAAVSRAVRLPTRFDTDLRFRNTETGAITLEGSEDFKSEEVIAVEGGYRIRPVSRLTLDVAVFSNRYDRLRSTELVLRPAPVIVLRNLLNARTSGFEFGATVHPVPLWRVHGAYAFLSKDLSFDPGSRDVYQGSVEGNDPAHRLSVRSYVDLPRGLAVDAFFRHVGRRPTPVVRQYQELDLRLGWMVRGGWEVSLVGQNLLHAHHSELLPVSAPHYDFRRGVSLRSAWHF
jgi:iron complex outermembrane receptor protein